MDYNPVTVDISTDAAVKKLCVKTQQREALELANRLCVEALPKFNWGASFLDANAIDLLNRVPAAIAAALEKREFIATDEEVRQATLRHCVGSNDEIEIDEPAKVSRGEDGPWVQAWVFVPREMFPDYKED